MTASIWYLMPVLISFLAAIAWLVVLGKLSDCRAPLKWRYLIYAICATVVISAAWDFSKIDWLKIDWLNFADDKFYIAVRMSLTRSVILALGLFADFWFDYLIAGFACGKNREIACSVTAAR